jgi:hypothetical protein
MYEKDGEEYSIVDTRARQSVIEIPVEGRLSAIGSQS